jgi:SHS2 domain-containing protein
MNRRYEYIEHTADLGFKAYGITVEELFVNAAEALFEVLVALDSVRARDKRIIHVDSIDLETLMVSWLNELLYHFEMDGFLLKRSQIDKMASCSLQATVCGESIDPARHEIRTTIKAATYHQLYVKRLNDLWESRVVLDL